GIGQVITYATVAPDTDNAYDLGGSSNRFRDLFLSGGVRDGTNETAIATIISLRDILAGIADGHAIFWDGDAGKFVSSAPDIEIDHGVIAGLADDDHLQYALLAGRGTGQTLRGGLSASNNLVLGSTAHATKGS